MKHLLPAASPARRASAPTAPGQNLCDPAGDGAADLGFANPSREPEDSAWDRAAATALRNIAHSASSVRIHFFAFGGGASAAPLLMIGLGALAGLRRRRRPAPVAAAARGA